MCLYGVFELRSIGSLGGVALGGRFLGVMPGANSLKLRMVIPGNDVIDVDGLVPAALAALLDDLTATAAAL